MAAPYILCLDTAQDYCAVALCVDGLRIGNLQSGEPIDHSRSIAVLTKQLLINYNVHRSSLVGIAVHLGPGSYTSLRTGLSFALGLRTALNVSLIGFNTLDVLRQLFMIHHPPSSGHLWTAVALPDGAFYGGLLSVRAPSSGEYFSDEQQMRKLINTFAETPEAVKYLDKVVIKCEGKEKEYTINDYEAACWTWIHVQFTSGLSDTNTCQPLYIRPPYITQPKKVVI